MTADPNRRAPTSVESANSIVSMAARAFGSLTLRESGLLGPVTITFVKQALSDLPK